MTQHMLFLKTLAQFFRNYIPDLNALKTLEICSLKMNANALHKYALIP